MSEGYRWVDDADLTTRNTFGVAARAAHLVELDAIEALRALFAQPPVGSLTRSLAGDAPLLVLGGGSNLLFAGDPQGVVLAIDAARVEVLADDGDAVIVRAEAGAPWHRFVMDMLARGFGGLENLALIPGTVGAAPIQNIGAYGVEVRERIVAVDVFERDTGRMRRMDNVDCAFAYRDSTFKRDAERWIITAVEFALARTATPRTDYAGLRDELAAMHIDTPDAMQVADAVIRIRRRKLPDPARLGNAGSFFKNPIVPAVQADALRAAHPALPQFNGDSDVARKLSAAWLIDACGWKGHRDGDAGVSADHALVLVNHGNATGAQLLDLARRIARSVETRFGVALEPEPRLIGARW